MVKGGKPHRRRPKPQTKLGALRKRILANKTQNPDCVWHFQREWGGKVGLPVWRQRHLPQTHITLCVIIHTKIKGTRYKSNHWSSITEQNYNHQALNITWFDNLTSLVPLLHSHSNLTYIPAYTRFCVDLTLPGMVPNKANMWFRECFFLSLTSSLSLCFWVNCGWVGLFVVRHNRNVVRINLNISLYISVIWWERCFWKHIVKHFIFLGWIYYIFGNF